LTGGLEMRYNHLAMTARVGLAVARDATHIAWRFFARIVARLPEQVKDRTFRAVFEFPATVKEPKAKTPKPSRTYRNTIYLAQEWHKALENGDCSSPADLARKLGVSRARVTQVLRLLRLAPEVLKRIAALGDLLPSPIVTERRLRPIVNLPAAEQRQRVEAILASSESI
jgi:hypothetical protein